MKASKIILAIFAIALVAFSIWFCIPKKMDTLLGDDKIESFSATVIQAVVEDGIPRYDIWETAYTDAIKEYSAGLADILSSSRYRPLLKTLSQPTVFDLNGEYQVNLILIMSDGSTQFVNFMGEDLVLLSSSPLNLILRPTDREVCNRLAEFIKEIGQKS